MERVVRAAAFLVAQWVVDGQPDYESFQVKRDRAAISAFAFADGEPPPLEVAREADAIRRIDAQRDGRGTGADEGGALSAFRLVADSATAVLVGHELAHVNGERCPIGTASGVEESKLWDSVYRSTGGHRVFCAAPLARFEVRADRCAARFIHALTSRSAEPDAVRRLGAEMAAYLGYFGARPPTEPRHPRPSRLQGYLHGPFRALLFAAEATGGSNPAVCGGAARLFVFGVQETFKTCAGEGDISDEILAVLPRGVESSWNGRPWTAASWTCAN